MIFCYYLFIGIGFFISLFEDNILNCYFDPSSLSSELGEFSESLLFTNLGSFLSYSPLVLLSI